MDRQAAEVLAPCPRLALAHRAGDPRGALDFALITSPSSSRFAPRA